MPDELTVAPQAHLGLFIKTGDGPQPCVADWKVSLARICVLYPDTVKPADDEARELVERVRHEPETVRLVAALATHAVPTHHLPKPRARSPRPRSRRTRAARASRGDASSSDDPDEPPGLGGLGLTELCAGAGVSAKRMEMFLAYFEARGIVECDGEKWRLTSAADAEYGHALRSVRAGNVPLEPDDDDGLTHFSPGPQKAAVAA